MLILLNIFRTELSEARIQYEKVQEFLYSLPNSNELRYAYNETKSESKGALVEAWNDFKYLSTELVNKIYSKLPRKLKYLVRAAKKFEAKVHRKLVCLEPNLRRKMGKMSYPENGMPIKSKFDIFGKVKSLKDQKYDFWASVDDPEDEDDHVEYIEDCFPDIPRRKFGWSVKYTIMKDERCTFDLSKVTDDMPKCVITNNAKDNDLFQSQQYAQERQIREGFRSSAPVECRVTLSPTYCLGVA